MTGRQLRELRVARGLTREKMAKELGNCSASGIVKWESDISPVPSWVAEKILRTVKVELPLEDLHELMDFARSKNIGLHELLSGAIRDYLAAKRKK